MTTTKDYDSLNRLKAINSAPSVSSAANFDYTYNDANQRTRLTLANQSYWDFGYDELGQATNGTHRWVDGSLVMGQQYQYVSLLP